MTIQALTAFFMWCTIINASLLILSAIMIIPSQDLVYRMHSKWFSISRETFNVAIYSCLGLFKIAILVFNAVPWIALLIIG
jgi:Family of unknown function (DUF6868)